MKKKYQLNGYIAAGLAAAMLLSACAGTAPETSAAADEAAAESTQQETAAETAAKTETDGTESSEASEAETAADEGAEASDEGVYLDDTLLRVGSLKGPTTMGLVNMMDDKDLPFHAEFTMAAAADELTAEFVSGGLDIVLVPSNLAAVLYNKTEGKAQVLDINTLGVLYGLTGDESVKSIADLNGKTVYMTGQGQTPQFTFEHLLKENGLEGKVKLEFKSEPTEIAALLKEDPTKIAVVPQPFATVVQQQNPDVKEFLDLTAAWREAQSSEGSELVTGVTVVNSDFLAAHEALVAEFVLEHQDSALKANEDVDATAELVAKYGIIEKAPIAKLAIPKCNIVCLTGEEMKEALSGYLEVLYAANPQSVGGKLPGDDFYAFTENAE